MEKDKMKVVSLFTGAGGFDVGFAGGFGLPYSPINVPQTNFTTLFACDIEPAAKIAWEKYFIDVPEGTFKLASVVELNKRHNAGEKVYPQNPDVVVGGPPCQDLSLNGKRKGGKSTVAHDGRKITGGRRSHMSTNRGKLYLAMRDAVEIMRPKIFILENVTGLRSHSKTEQRIMNVFKRIGYLVLPPQELDFSMYGVPQERKRFILIGFDKRQLKVNALKRLSNKVILPDFCPYPHALKLKPITLREAFIDLKEPDVSEDPSQQAYTTNKYPDELQRGKWSQGYDEIKHDEPSRTIIANGGNAPFRRLSIENGGMYPDEINTGKIERRLTVREYARIQTFPDTFQFLPHVSMTVAYKLIGNAVPPLFAYHLAKRLENNWALYFDTKEIQVLTKVIPTSQIKASNKKENITQNFLHPGTLYPFWVLSDVESEYNLICGERRLEDAKKAGLSEVQCFVVTGILNVEAALTCLINETARNNIPPLKKARMIVDLHEVYTEKTRLARLLKTNPNCIRDYLKILTLPYEVQSFFTPDEKGCFLNKSHAAVLFKRLGFLTINEIINLARRALLNGLSSRELAAITNKKR
jgi:DNA (cytosine-5)-methyltransferase 1